MTKEEREDRRRIAIERLNADYVSQRIYNHFLALSMANGANGFYIEDAEQDYRFLMKGDIVPAWKEHRAEFLELLRDALPDFRIRERAKSKSVLADADKPAGEQTFVFQTLDQIPEAFRKDARVLPNGSYILTGTPALLVAMKVDEKKDPAAKDPDDKDASAKAAKDAADDLKKAGRGPFELSRDEAADFRKYTALSEKAAAAGTCVSIVD